MHPTPQNIKMIIGSSPYQVHKLHLFSILVISIHKLVIDQYWILDTSLQSKLVWHTSTILYISFFTLYASLWSICTYKVNKLDISVSCFFMVELSIAIYFKPPLAINHFASKKVNVHASLVKNNPYCNHLYLNNFFTNNHQMVYQTKEILMVQCHQKVQLSIHLLTSW